MRTTQADARDVENLSAPTRPRRRGSVGMVLRAIQVRLRFLIVLGVAFLVAGRWESLRTAFERLTRSTHGGNASAVSNDTEYFCPMDPGVLSDWPGKCGICNMNLVRRKKGEAVMLPSGVVSRMQVSPYRVQLAGIRTSPVDYQPLARVVEFSGPLKADGASSWTVEADLFDRDMAFLADHHAAEVLFESKTLPAKLSKLSKINGTSRHRAILEVSDPDHRLRPGLVVKFYVHGWIAEDEPFRSMPADLPVFRKGEPNAVYLCSEHAEVIRDGPGLCPVDRKSKLEPQPLLKNQRLRWWCPMHPKVTADHPGSRCDECGGMVLVPRVLTYRPVGQVLAVPESAVVDTGARALVYVERMPGMFDGVEVTLGPRCGESYPVIRGLEPGQRVATAGAFLIDAETRLNPSLAASYFGSGRANQDVTARSPEKAEDFTALAKVQKVCPVTDKPLGSMGAPKRVHIKGRTVLICCDGCREALESDPENFLSRLQTTKNPPN